MLLAMGASLVHIDMAPGLKLLLGPLFFMLAYRLWGVRLAVVAAILSLSLSILTLHHPFALVLALVELAFIARFSKNHDAPILPWIAVFHMTAGLIVGPLMIWITYDSQPLVMLLIWSKVVINDLVMAVTADVVLIFIMGGGIGQRIGWRREKGFVELARSGSSFIVIMMAFFLYAAESSDLARQISDIQYPVHAQAASSLLREPLGAQSRLLPAKEGVPAIFLTHNKASLGSPDVMRRFGCNELATLAEVERGDYRIDRRMKTCLYGALPTQHGAIYYVYAPRDQIQNAYLRMYRHLWPVFVIVVLMFLLRQYLVRLITRAFEAWDRTINGFGTPDLARPETTGLIEFSAPLENFVNKNNQFVAMQGEQKHYGEAILQMKKSIGLKLLADISYDETTGRLMFRNLDPDFGSVEQDVLIHPVDRAEIAAVADMNEAIVEFRFADDGPDDWHLLLVRNLTGRGKWSAGAFKRLMTPRVGKEELAHRARLVEMGSMASALSHELKQPLFTIALAAENGAWQLGDASEGILGKAATKFRKIGEQATRARDIIDRMARYSRADNTALEVFNLFDAVQSATSFLRPVFVQTGVSVNINDVSSARPMVRMARIGLEQIVVNALHNSADAIVQAREAGRNAEGHIQVTLADGPDDSVQLTVSDDGIGLPKEVTDKVFSPFFTTKAAGKGTGLGLYICQQIADEVGGRISLESGVEAGAVFWLTIPRYHPLDTAAETPTEAEA